MDVKLVNVLILGFGFMLLFTAFQTMSNIEKIILVSIHQDDPTFLGDGYISLSIIFASFSLCNWLAPSFLSYGGPRIAMLIGGTTYSLFMLTFLFPRMWLLYAMSVLLGAGAALTWIGQGTFLARCSDLETISRNSGIFWTLLQFSMFFGNLFVYFQFQDKQHIDGTVRSNVIAVLTSLAILGVLLLATLRKVDATKPATDTEVYQQKTNCCSAWVALHASFELFFTRKMLLLNATFLYTGFELAFFSGVYGASIGFTKTFHEGSKAIVGLIGIFVGIGEVIGGGLFGLVAVRTTCFGRNPIVVTGYVIHMIAYFLIYLNIPNTAAFMDTQNTSYFDPPIVWVALLCALLLGLGDACLNTQVYSILGGHYANQSTAAFALFKFTQSVAAAIGFFYSYQIGLHFQLIVLLVFATLGVVCFCSVENMLVRNENVINFTHNLY